VNAARALAVIAAVAAIGLGFAWLAGQGGAQWRGWPVYLICAALAFAINWTVFLPSALARTERFYDLTGAVTYTSVVLAALALSDAPDLRGVIVAGCVIIWCARLGLFLFTRINADGEDRRFRQIKTNPLRFLTAWTIQALWVTLTAAAALAVLTSPVRAAPDVFLAAGLALWVFGFGVEVIADAQKSRFRKDPTNAGRFITTGLWSWSQHPNYFGEIVLWTGVAVMAAPVLQGWAFITLISPVFVTLLLTRVSGIPLLDRSGRERWGEDPDYQAYQARTPKLIPRPPGKTPDRTN
jgi:steroid 5-alpha reductase family enzyme